MNSLPQSLEDAKNLISLIGFNAPDTLDHWEVNYARNMAVTMKELFVKTVEYADRCFFESDERIAMYYSKGKRSRTIVTVFGEVTFSRYRYFDRVTKKPFCFIDSLLRIRPRQRITSQVEALILHSVSYDHMSYEKSARPYGLSKGTVYNLIRKLNPDVYMPCLKEPVETVNLHIVADEDHVAIQNRSNPKAKRKDGSLNTMMIRHATIFTDVKKVCKGRNKLENRMIISQLENESVGEFTARVNEFVLENYKVSGRIFVYGDGAGWIKTLADETCGTYIHDKFHMKQSLMRVCGGKNNRKIRGVLERYLELDNKEMFRLVVKTLYPQMGDFKAKQLRYIMNSWEAYQKNFTEKGVKICCAEGINSHYFSEYFSSRPKGFSRRHMHRIGYLLSYSHSGYDLKSWYIDNLPDFIKTEGKGNSRVSQTYAEKLQASMPGIGFGKGSLYRTLVGISH